MKKILLVILILSCTAKINAQRYLSEVFTSASVTSDITYANNISVFPVPGAIDLKMDVYQPAGALDSLPTRPLIIYLHTGSFLPPVVNQNPTGSKTDSTVVEMCTQFAKRGYVVAAVDYRLGWVPTDPDQDVRTGTLLQAVYRAIQDAKACVRFFRADAANGNTYGVDTNNIILGGQGTGGYIALAYATLNHQSEIELPKFLSNSDNATYGYQVGLPYVNTAIMGDFDGYGGNVNYNNPNNSVGYSNHINFVFNMGGALGDSSWLEAGDAPMVCFHVPTDPFAPYGDGPVYVPTVPPQFVVDVSGSQTVVTKADGLGNNNCFLNAGFSDQYTMRANTVNGGEDGLFPFESAGPQAGPWEWYDSTSLVLFAQAIGYSASAGSDAYENGLATDPDMSKQKALAYIDTMQNYLNPRIVYCLNLSIALGINDAVQVKKLIQVYPNPAHQEVNINTNGVDVTIATLYDATGRIVNSIINPKENIIHISGNNFSQGIYLLKLQTHDGIITKEINFE